MPPCENAFLKEYTKVFPVDVYKRQLLHFYGVDTIIRIGSAGAIDPSLKIGDIVIAVSSCTTSSYSAQYHLPGSFAPRCV